MHVFEEIKLNTDCMELNKKTFLYGFGQKILVEVFFGELTLGQFCKGGLVWIFLSHRVQAGSWTPGL